jgi:hypothetical protein
MVGLSFDANTKAQPLKDLSLPKGGNQTTLLTRSGPFVTVELAPNLLHVGGSLMNELINRASAPKPAPKSRSKTNLVEGSSIELAREGRRREVRGAGCSLGADAPR